ncbi:MAG TPA: DUF2993 domain-containing protein [Streptosporangiaceae bacterium]|nr:DUF2993 domain-containing protein [Streptosporangiaceae bacterium]
MRKPIRNLLIALAVLVVLFVAVDRTSVAVAENQISNRVATAYNLPSKPAVGIAGFPFLTQVVAGDYQEIDISTPQVQANGVTLHNLAAHFMGVHASLSQLLGQGQASVMADQATGSATVPFAAISQRLPRGVHIKPSGSDLQVTAAARLQGVRRSCQATTALDVAGSGLMLTLVNLECAGVHLPVSVLPQSSFNIPLSALPLHLHLASVHITPGGLQIGVSARNVYFAKA